MRPDGGDLEQISARIGAGEAGPVIDRGLSLADAVEAHRLSEGRRARGKLVHVVDEKLAAEKAEWASHNADKPVG